MASKFLVCTLLTVTSCDRSGLILDAFLVGSNTFTCGKQNVPIGYRASSSCLALTSFQVQLIKSVQKIRPLSSLLFSVKATSSESHHILVGFPFPYTLFLCFQKQFFLQWCLNLIRQSISFVQVICGPGKPSPGTIPSTSKCFEMQPQIWSQSRLICQMRLSCQVLPF